MTKKPIIAIDVDDVLAASAEGWVEHSNRRWGTNLTVEDYLEDWATMWQVDRDTVKQRADEMFNDRVVMSFEHRGEAVDILTHLTKRFELVIATSRNTVIHDQTLTWLDKYFGGIFSNIHMAGIYDNLHKDSHLMTKGDLIRNIKADYLIDDQPKHCIAVAEDGKKAVLFGNYSWNRDADLPDGVTRCADWAAVGVYFDGQR